jgi:hypothetical protein
MKEFQAREAQLSEQSEEIGRMQEKAGELGGMIRNEPEGVARAVQVIEKFL